MARNAARLLAFLPVSALAASSARAQDTADLEVAKQQFQLGKTYCDQAAYGKAYKRGDEWSDVQDFANTGKTFETTGIVGILTGNTVGIGGGFTFRAEAVR